jgi:ADP-ribose pyrophosphatase YjhB (NUDIX family)
MRASVRAIYFAAKFYQVLLVQGNHGASPGKWGAASGLIQFGETSAEAAVRILTEETGLKAESFEQRADLLIEQRAHLLLYNSDDGSAVSSDICVIENRSYELPEIDEGRAKWVPTHLLHETDLIDFMHITLPLVLTPGSLLMGTISHSASNAWMWYELHHHMLERTHTMRGPTEP